MTRKIAALVVASLIALAALAVPVPASAEIGARRDIHVGPGETQDKIFSLGGHVVVEGSVKEDVVVIGGSITVSGEVGQSVVGIGSRISVSSTAVIGDDLAALGGTLEKEPGCRVGGDTIYFQTAEIGDKLFEKGLWSALLTTKLIPIIIVAKLIVIFLWLLAAVLGAVLFPQPLAFAAQELRRSFWPAFGIGLASVVVFTGLVIVAVVLSFALIGIPLLLALTAAGLVVKVFGRLIVFYFLGDSLLRALGARAVGAMGAVLTGLLAFSLIGFVPFFGFLFGIVMNIVGWGIALRTKFGTRENWFHRTAAPSA